MTPQLVGTPNIKYSGSQNYDTLTSDSLTVQDGDVIVCKEVNADAGQTISQPTIAPGSITMTSRALSTQANYCGVRISTWVVTGNPGSIVVTATFSGSSPAQRSMVIEIWRNAQLGTSVAVNSTYLNDNSTTGFSGSVTTAANDSIVTWCAGDWRAVAFGTIGWRSSASTDGDGSNLGGDGLTYSTYYAYQTAATAGAQTFGLTTPTSATRFTYFGIEIQNADTGNYTGPSTTLAVTASTSSDGNNPDKYGDADLAVTAGRVVHGGSDYDPPPSLDQAGASTSSTAAVTAISPAVPAGSGAGDLSVLCIAMKPYSATVSSSGVLSTWTKIGEATNGTTANGTDVGSTKVAMFVKESAAAGAIGNITFGSSPNTIGAVIHTYKKKENQIWDYSTFTTGGDAVNDYNYSATGAGGLSIAVDDMIVAATAVNSDLGTTTISAQAIGGCAGATITTQGVRTTGASSGNGLVTTGNDCRIIVVDATCTAGSSASAPTATYTLSQNTSGTSLWLRLRLQKGSADEPIPVQALIAADGEVSAGALTKASTPVTVTAAVTAQAGALSTPVAVTATVSANGSVNLSGASTTLAGTAALSAQLGAKSDVLAVTASTSAESGAKSTTVAVTASPSAEGVGNQTHTSTALAVTAGVTAESGAKSTTLPVVTALTADGNVGLSGTSTTLALTAAATSESGAQSTTLALTATVASDGVVSMSSATTMLDVGSSPVAAGRAEISRASDTLGVTAGLTAQLGAWSSLALTATVTADGQADVSRTSTVLALTATISANGVVDVSRASTTLAVTASPTAQSGAWSFLTATATLDAAGRAEITRESTTLAVTAAPTSEGTISGDWSGTSTATTLTAATSAAGYADVSRASTVLGVTAAATAQGGAPSTATVATASLTAGGVADVSRASTVLGVTATATAQSGAWSALPITATVSAAGRGEITRTSTVLAVTASVEADGTISGDWSGGSDALIVTAGTSSAGRGEITRTSTALEVTAAPSADGTVSGAAALSSGSNTLVVDARLVSHGPMCEIQVELTAEGSVGTVSDLFSAVDDTIVTAAESAAGHADQFQLSTALPVVASVDSEGRLSGSASTTVVVTATGTATGTATAATTTVPVAATLTAGGAVNLTSASTALVVTAACTANGGAAVSAASTALVVTAAGTANGVQEEAYGKASTPVVVTAGLTADGYLSAASTTPLAVTAGETAGGSTGISQPSTVLPVVAGVTANINLAGTSGAPTTVTVALTAGGQVGILSASDVVTATATVAADGSVGLTASTVTTSVTATFTSAGHLTGLVGEAVLPVTASGTGDASVAVAQGGTVSIGVQVLARGFVGLQLAYGRHRVTVGHPARDDLVSVRGPITSRRTWQP